MIRAEYVDGDLSCRELAEKHGVSVSALRKRATAEHWVAERRQHREIVVKLTAKNLADTRARANADKLRQVMAAADMLGDQIERVLREDPQQLFRHLSVADGAMVESVQKKLDTRGVRELASALRDLTQVMRNLYDLPTMQEQTAMELARERVELERLRIAGGQEENDEAGVIEIGGGETEGMEDEQPEQSEQI